MSADRAAAPSGVVTFLFTDVEGSTRRWEADADGMRAALAAHDEVLRGAIEAHGGWLFKHTGDGVCAAFASPRSAADAAVAAQRALELPVRMGLATAGRLTRVTAAPHSLQNLKFGGSPVSHDPHGSPAIVVSTATIPAGVHLNIVSPLISDVRHIAVLSDVVLRDFRISSRETKLDPLLGLHFRNVLGDALRAERGLARRLSRVA